MPSPAGRRGSFLLVAPLLLISILLEQYCIVRFFPWVGDCGGIQPMIIFLDIPLRLPVIDWIPVGVLFIFLYLVVVTPELSRHRAFRAGLLWEKGWAVLAGWWVMLLCLVAAGGLYYLVEDQLPKQVRNGIDSFGIRADIAIPFREGLVHLHGGMIMLIALLIGGRFFLRRTALPAVVAISEPAPMPMPIAAPIRTPIPPPEPAPATVRPCVVQGVLEPH